MFSSHCKSYDYDSWHVIHKSKDGYSTYLRRKRQDPQRQQIERQRAARPGRVYASFEWSHAPLKAAAVDGGRPEGA
jgi:hypothetical protein